MRSFRLYKTRTKRDQLYSHTYNLKWKKKSTINCVTQQDHEYEFLDLSDVDDNERTRLSSALLQLSDKNAPASLNDDAVQAQCRTTDDECRLPCNIQSNSIANSSWPNQIANGKLSQMQ